ncbi:MAG: single-stranded DNA-binding protein [Sweet potato little leaf phytoplasma]|uniref:Single-stranded DNA-binding protein n=2 Tax=Candidatus Phytoplasma TaxID=33926 RepID=A0ABN0J7R1_PEWBP|nr:MULTISPECIES: single-stranded DNA-binding protein [Phytoplasma]MDV3139281.1 single-stranded DNA-binding protein [Candidatus Phytoplasma australasiaticum]QLL37096.1 single-strand DNA-binding protein ['Echinacea purpurea' witches'-broom phytoplasma]WEX20641.1 MAG: single-stranded DNA-binding protein [Candidatus Phytoplasma aurantifolia]EMR14488.1 single-stranded DNA-binding protein [Peanut witches'-broom phytoplasma NTU2011]MDO7987056.1 single-stranded DNA-binding protein [Sweet potato little
MLNRVFLIGRITKDPEIRFTKETNVPYVIFHLIIDRGYTNQEGKKESDLIRCIAWDKQAESLTRYITKGSLLAIEGRVRTEIYEDHNNQQKTTFDTKILCTNIKFLESKEYSDYKKNKQKSEYSNHLDVEQTSHNRDIKKNNQSFSDIKEDEDESLF